MLIIKRSLQFNLKKDNFEKFWSLKYTKKGIKILIFLYMKYSKKTPCRGGWGYCQDGFWQLSAINLVSEHILFPFMIPIMRKKINRNKYVFRQEEEKYKDNISVHSTFHTCLLIHPGRPNTSSFCFGLLPGSSCQSGHFRLVHSWQPNKHTHDE